MRGVAWQRRQSYRNMRTVVVRAAASQGELPAVGLQPPDKARGEMSSCSHNEREWVGGRSVRRVDHWNCARATLSSNRQAAPWAGLGGANGVNHRWLTHAVHVSSRCKPTGRRLLDPVRQRGVGRCPRNHAAPEPANNGPVPRAEHRVPHLFAWSRVTRSAVMTASGAVV